MMKLNLRSLILAAALLATALVPPALAQTAGAWTRVNQTWWPTGKASLTLSGTTGNVALPSTGNVAKVCNTGAVDAYVALGTTNAVAATVAAGYLVSANDCAVLDLKPFSTAQTYLAGITGGSAGALVIYTGLGAPPGFNAAAALNAIASAVTSGQCASPCPVITPSFTPSSDTALGTNRLLKSGAGTLYSMNVFSSASVIVLVFDATSLPGNGAVTPKRWFLLPATGGNGATLSVTFDPPLAMATGIVIGCSTTLTTPFTLAAATGDCGISGSYQ